MNLTYCASLHTQNNFVIHLLNKEACFLFCNNKRETNELRMRRAQKKAPSEGRRDVLWHLAAAAVPLIRYVTDAGTPRDQSTAHQQDWRRICLRRQKSDPTKPKTNCVRSPATPPPPPPHSERVSESSSYSGFVSKPNANGVYANGTTLLGVGRKQREHKSLYADTPNAVS